MNEVLFAAAIIGAWLLAIGFGWWAGGSSQFTWAQRWAGWRAVASSLWRHKGNRREMLLEVQAEEAEARAQAVGGTVPLDGEGKPRLAYLRFRPNQEGKLATRDVIDLLDPRFSQQLTFPVAEQFLWVGRQGWIEWREPGHEPSSVKATITGHEAADDGRTHVLFDLVSAWPPE